MTSTHKQKQQAEAQAFSGIVSAANRSFINDPDGKSGLALFVTVVGSALNELNELREKVEALKSEKTQA